MRLVDTHKIVTGTAPIALTAASDYVSLKNYGHATAIITIDNGATVTASEISLLQATAVAGTSAKALAFDTVWANTDTGAADTLTSTAVTSNTFNSDTTNAKNLMYVIEIDAADLDVTNGFDCIAVSCANGANSVGAITFVLGESRYQSPAAVAAITD
jgi:hypothetical protein